MASLGAIDFEGVDNMQQALEPSLVAQDDSETLSENVFRRIQAAIVKGEIAPGSKISEPELARTYGISRGPLREAIHRLEGHMPAQNELLGNDKVQLVAAYVYSLSHGTPEEKVKEAARNVQILFTEVYTSLQKRLAVAPVKKRGYSAVFSSGVPWDKL